MKICSSSLFVSPVTNFFSWQKINGLYNSSEFLCQLNYIKILFIVLGYQKKLNKTHCKRTMCSWTCLLWITCTQIISEIIVFGSSYSSHCTIIIILSPILIRTLWFIHVILFLPLTFTVLARIKNTLKVRKILVMCIMFWDKLIIGFFKFSFCSGYILHFALILQ